MAKNIFLMLIILFLLDLPSALRSQVAVLQPGGALNQSDYDTLRWRTLSEPTVNFWNEAIGLGDSIAVWFKPEGPCSLMAIRVYSNDFEGTGIANVWDGSRYDGHITTTDSTDSNGWIGDVVNDQWIPGSVMGHSPIGWSMDDEDHHYWGLFPFTITSQLSGGWFEIPTRLGVQGEVVIGDKPFFVTITFYTTFGLGWAAEDEGTIPYHSFRYYNYADGHGSPGPDGHFGWFIHSQSVWIEAIVRYFDTRITQEETDLNIPSEWSLLPNYPNPFNPETTIEYVLPEATQVKLEVFNVLGEVVDVLVKREQEAGYHVIKWDGSDAPSGVYFYRLVADKFTSTRCMVLMK